MSTPRTSRALAGSLVLAACWANPSEKGDYVDPTMTTSGTTTTTSEPTTSTTTTTHGPTSVTTVDTSTEDTTESDTSTSEPASCGDGTVDVGEMCDDPQGNKEPVDAMNGECTTACKPAGCRDAEKNADEECDDGNDADEDDCTNACKLPVCGDGFIQAGVEECDNPRDNKDPADAMSGECTTACKPAGCGDEEKNANEDCDDGNAVDSDGCSHCFTPRIVFITSTSYQGSLGGMNGVMGADSKCQARADAAIPKLPGTFKAWISGDPEDSEPAMRFLSDNFMGQYVLRTNPPKLVAQGWSGLTSGALTNAITYDESGFLQDKLNVWTNTDSDGKRLGSNNCGDWSSTASMGALGKADMTIKGVEWTNNASSIGCDFEVRLYCFQTGP